MKRHLFLIIVLSFIICGFKVAEVKKEEPKSYEIILVDDEVEFRNAKAISIDIVLRNIGEKEIDAIDTYFGFSVIWDGKEYKHNDAMDWNGPGVILPKSAMTSGISLSEYEVPEKCLKPGRHTISLKDDVAESNRLTIFIKEVEK